MRVKVRNVTNSNKTFRLVEFPASLYFFIFVLWQFLLIGFYLFHKRQFFFH